MRKATAIAYWLIPARPVRELFSEIIRILAEELEAPRFEPHLTLFATPGSDQSARKLLRRIKAQRIHLPVRDVGFSAEFSKTLFVRLESSDALTELRNALWHDAKSRDKSWPDPHVSLIYKKLAPQAQSELASAMKFPFPGVVFDCVKAIRCSAPARTRADVEGWKVIAKKSLR
ncbi:MAG: 2'-5' RNA ligase family protein [Chthoniobacterales bacterium]